MLTLVYLNVGTGALLSLLSVPLILRRVGPNPLYGFRVKATLENPDLWYDVNAYAGWRLLAAGLVDIGSAVGLSLVPGLTVDQYALGCLALAGTVLVAGLIQSAVYLRAHHRP